MCDVLESNPATQGDVIWPSQVLQLFGGEIVFDSGNGITVSTLSVTAAAFTSTDGGITIGWDGSAASPAITRSDDIDTGIYWGADNVMGVACGGSNVATFTTTGLQLATVLAGQYGGTGLAVIAKFHAYKSSDQSLTASSTTKVTFDTEVFDVGSNFASSTFTAPSTGTYMFGAACFNSGAVSTEALYLYKNGSQFKRLGQRGVGDGDILEGSVTIQLTSGDTVEIYLFTDQNVTITGAATITYFWGFQIP